MSGYVGAQHEFHDAGFVRGWATRFVPTPERLALFDMIADQISRPSVPHAHVVELGIGPGYMARHILERNRAVSYEGVDFSDAFFEIARETAGDLLSRLTLTKADLMNQSWPQVLSKTQKLICDRLVNSQGLPVYQVLMLPVETIGLSVSNTGTRDSLFSVMMLSHICWTTLLKLSVTTSRRRRSS